jgi:hypothetical protein
MNCRLHGSISFNHQIAFSLFFLAPWLDHTMIIAAKEQPSCDPAEESCSATEANGYSAECGLWLAPSTLKGAGLGMYAGKDYKQGELVGSGDVVVAHVDHEQHQFQLGDEANTLWNEYFWNGVSFL